MPCHNLTQNVKKHKKKKGKVRVELAQVHRLPTLLDFLAGGLQINLTVSEAHGTHMHTAL